MESYKKYVDEVRQKGTACDIARAASGLHDRADELLTFDVIERSLVDLGHADVTFFSSDYIIDDINKTLGHLLLNSFKPGKTNQQSLFSAFLHEWLIIVMLLWCEEDLMAYLAMIGKGMVNTNLLWNNDADGDNNDNDLFANVFCSAVVPVRQ